ncbi:MULTISPECIES: HrpT family type III secretion system protein [unclassified Brenneria]|uniref:HrpT family type III secretion system protein n=1 Tax=unclassified Brenneria TaxID=2634434 RepID=UPI0015564141|nr:MULTISPECIES: HrpT family type III secretion system protein [unclassified Brenneria]MBJ7220883.1 type III secretion protein HrpT [Brenneria sp. L3-3C-1]MEE3642123.1 HrpT family type III secretion system protein [Brenneria sp. L3_3C_1]MEE3650503.1 HrpT family type III secretion system protein [Brenneria sp. HEZEL_4_2_4]NPD00459.1 type III secretion protein HrpT [Brenneria sp. hezel4-2-4]
MIWRKYGLLIATALLLSACSAPRSVVNCTSVTCRPQPDDRQLIIWWQPDLRSGPADYSRVSLDE